MNRLPDLSHQRIVRALERGGFFIKRQGKHIYMYSPDRRVVAVIPRHNPVQRTTLLRILRQIGLSPDEFNNLV